MHLDTAIAPEISWRRCLGCAQMAWRTVVGLRRFVVDQYSGCPNIVSLVLQPKKITGVADDRAIARRWLDRVHAIRAGPSGSDNSWGGNEPRGNCRQPRDQQDLCGE